MQAHGRLTKKIGLISRPYIWVFFITRMNELHSVDGQHLIKRCSLYVADTEIYIIIPGTITWPPYLKQKLKAAIFEAKIEGRH